MAVPKKKAGRSAQGHRRAKWKASIPAIVKCNNCDEMRLAHTVCSFCGYYNDKPASKKLEE
ncbi:MAG: 50S ribosomal protein L32 [bacterium]